VHLGRGLEPQQRRPPASTAAFLAFYLRIPDAVPRHSSCRPACSLRRKIGRLEHALARRLAGKTRHGVLKAIAAHDCPRLVICPSLVMKIRQFVTFSSRRKQPTVAAVPPLRKYRADMRPKQSYRTNTVQYQSCYI